MRPDAAVHRGELFGGNERLLQRSDRVHSKQRGRECGFDRAFDVDRDVFARLHKPMPAVETIDFCNFDKNQIQRIHADVLVATDVVRR